MKEGYYFLRAYWSDFIASISAIILSLVTFYYSQDVESSFVISTIIILFFLFIILYLRSKGRDFYFTTLQKRTHKDDWIGSGRFEYSRVSNCFQLTQADHGYIYSKCLNWSDYKFEFEFKIRKDCVGAVVRAVNLSNCVMIQINQKEGRVRPHVSINGSWIVFEDDTVRFVFKDNLSLEKWYKCRLTCEKEAINIEIFHNKEKIFDREWKLPEGAYVFEFKRDEEDRNPVRIPFPINLEYGSVGFRNAAEEKALVKNALIEKI